MKIRFTVWLLTLTLLLGCAEQLFAQGTAFVYHGQLSQRGRPARGEHDLRFGLFNMPTNGNSIASQTVTDVRVQDGEFTVTLDFGPSVFDGSERWLEISVKQRHGDFTTLKPRQKIMPVPYAIMANSASNLLGNVAASQITGPIPAEQLSGLLPATALNGTYPSPVNLDNPNNQFGGDGSALANVNAASVNGLSASNFWQLNGNSGTTAGLNFLGTTDNESLDFKVNNVRALRLQPGTNGSPNIIAGHAGNIAGLRRIEFGPGPIKITHYPTGIYGATISGGGATDATNTIASHFGTIGGGSANSIDTSVRHATIAGGFANSVQASGRADYVSIGGGVSNVVCTPAGVIGGGIQNRIGYQPAGGSGEQGNTIGGGVRNYIDYYTVMGGSTIAGGIQNASSGPCNAIAGGFGNKITRISSHIGHSAIGGGYANWILPSYSPVGGFRDRGGYSVITGGLSNRVSGSFATIAGGTENQATEFAFAAGRQAKAIHLGSFVWADCNGFDFVSSATNAFSVRATGGTRFISAIDTNGAPTAGVELPAGGGAWATLSDRDSKENFAPVNPREVLERVDRMPIQTWNYKSQGDAVRHIGPTAQDFAAAFQVGESDHRITTVDADGVALAAIQGLSQVVKEKDTKIRQLQERIERLEQFMNQQSGGQQ